ncbi:MAG: hypothetical protein HC802_05775 [Caldilineaceae bacterium]|nr:hypothetical protein [Caldilineaceae bacterium]
MTPIAPPGQGAAYSFEDSPGAGRFEYWLEDVDSAGVSTLHGPVAATIGVAEAPGNGTHRIFLPYLVR